MKLKILLINIFFFSILVASAQQISFQTNLGKISSGKASKNINQVYFLKTSIIQHSANGNIVYAEKNTIQSDASGSFTLNIGSGTKIKGNIDSVNWSDGSFFLIIESDTSKKNQYAQKQI